MRNGRFIVLRIKKGEFATGRKSEEWKDCSYSGTFYNNTSEQLIKAALYSLFLFESCTFVCPSITFVAMDGHNA